MNDVRSLLAAELETVMADRWPQIRRRVAERIAADLLARLDRPPAPASRVHVEHKIRAESICRGEAA
jgi:hypothetical protein